MDILIYYHIGTLKVCSNYTFSKIQVMMNKYDCLVRMISHYLIIVSVKFKKISLKKFKKI